MAGEAVAGAAVAGAAVKGEAVAGAAVAGEAVGPSVAVTHEHCRARGGVGRWPMGSGYRKEPTGARGGGQGSTLHLQREECCALSRADGIEDADEAVGNKRLEYLLQPRRRRTPCRGVLYLGGDTWGVERH